MPHCHHHRSSGVSRLPYLRVCSVQGLAFAMLKRTGKGGVAPFKGTGFVTGRTVNARRETEWSAPTYFDMTVYSLGPPFRGGRPVLVDQPGITCVAGPSAAGAAWCESIDDTSVKRGPDSACI